MRISSKYGSKNTIQQTAVIFQRCGMHKCISYEYDDTVSHISYLISYILYLISLSLSHTVCPSPWSRIWATGVPFSDSFLKLPMTPMTGLIMAKVLG